jgi:ferric-dicitrate binding protein FerR (iron transport regulator)
MRNRLTAQVMVAVLCGLLAGPALSPLSAAPPAAMGRVVANAPATLNGVGIPREATVFSGDLLATGDTGWARIYLAEGEQIHVAARSEARAARAGERIDVELLNGHLLLQTHAGSGINVQTNGLAILPNQDAVWEVTRTAPNEVLVAARSGSVEVRGTNRSLTVPAGRSARVTTTVPASPAAPVKGAGGGLSAGAKGAIIGGIVGAVIGTAVIVTNQTQSNQLVSPSGI